MWGFEVIILGESEKLIKKKLLIIYLHKLK